MSALVLDFIDLFVRGKIEPLVSEFLDMASENMLDELLLRLKTGTYSDAELFYATHSYRG